MSFCCSKKIKRQSDLYCWRASLGTKRRPQALAGILINLLTNVSLTFVFWNQSYSKGSTVYDNQLSRSFTLYSPNAMQQQPDLKNMNTTQFAKTCRDLNAATIGLVNPANNQSDYAMGIFQTLQKGFDEEEMKFFKPTYFTEEGLDTHQEQMNIEDLTDIMCFAIKVNEFSEENSKYDIQFMPAPSFVFSFPQNQTFSQKTTYDWIWQTDAKAIGYLETLSAITDTVLQDTQKSKAVQTQVNHAIKFVPTTTAPANGQGDPIGAGIVMGLTLAFGTMIMPFYHVLIKDENEERIMSLSRVMGYNHLAKVVMQFYICCICMLVVTWPCMILFKFTLWPNSDLTLILFLSGLYVIAQGLQQIVLLNFMGTGGVILAFVGPFVMSLLTASVFAKKPLPLEAWVPVTMFVTVQQYFLQLLFNAESKALGDANLGLKWSNIGEITVDQYTALSPALYTMAAMIVMYPLFIVWQLPRYYYRDGKKRGCCYCFDPELRSLDTELNEETTHLLQDLAGDQVLMQDEMELYRQGFIEHPNLQQQIEDDPNYLKQSLRVKGLKKAFPNLDLASRKEFPKKAAVDDLSMSMYKDQIFVLLGHNGAGKTTTLNMLTGFGNIHPDEGDVQAFGIDLFKDKARAQRITGICPQHDALIFNMTVEENLFWFLGMRGMSNEEILDYAKQMLPKVDLKKKRHDFVGTLSGGQKRKLQLIIALAGDTKFVLLDEPSSGMDPTARRETWDLIKQQAKGKIIVLTTHYMDEADALGDRIAIMSKGKLKTCGSSLFLKEKYGLGILLEVDPIDKTKSMKPLEDFLAANAEQQKLQLQDNQEQQEAFGQKQESKEEMKPIKGKLDESDLYQIILPKQLIPNFETIFNELDNQENHERFNMKGYNVRVTSLEEVFNKLGEEEEILEAGANDELPADSIPEDNLRVQPRKLTSCEQFCTVFKMRAWVNVKTFQYIIVILMVSFGVFLATFIPNLGKFKPPEEMLATNVSQTYNEGQVFSINFPPSDQMPNQEQLKFDDVINSAVFNAKGLEGQNLIEKIEQSAFKNTPHSNVDDTESDQLNFINLQEMAMKNKSNFTYQNDFNQTDICSATIYFGKQKNEANNVSVPIYIGMNASQPVTLYMTPALVYNTIVNKYAGKDVNLSVSIKTLKTQPLYAQASMPPIQGLQQSSMFQFAGLSILFLTQFGVMANKRSGIDQMIELSGVSSQMRAFGNLAAELPKFILSGFIIVLFTVILPLGGNILGMEVCSIFVLLNQCAYFLYYDSMTAQEHSKSSVMIFIVSTIGQFLFPTLLVFLSTSGSTMAMTMWPLEVIFCMDPIIAQSTLLVKIIFRARFAAAFNSTNIGIFQPHVCLFEIIGMSLGAIFYFVKAMLNNGYGRSVTDDGMMKKLGASDFDIEEQQKKDNDVTAEYNRTQRVIKGELPSETITVSDLHKFFKKEKPQEKKKEVKDDDQKAPGLAFEDEAKEEDGKKLLKAVNGISFSLNNNESFALLGVNGAGKSTTFKMLTMNHYLTKGQIQINGNDSQSLIKDPSLLQGMLGYCPQTDVFTAFLTVYENVQFFARIKGVPEEQLDRIVKSYIQRFELSNFTHTLAHYLSGGNKRKLTTLCAMIGGPSAILLDESSAGVDPFARRRLWKTIRDESKNSALIVTTHSMEEAEALSTKLAIMVDGEFKCFGTAQHIKQKFGQGFTVKVKLDLDKIDRKNINVKNKATKEIKIMYTAGLQDGSGSFESESNVSNTIRSSTITLKIGLNEAIEKIKQWLPKDGVRVAIDCEKELCPDGLLAGYYNRLVNNQPIDMQGMLETVLVLNEISLIIALFTREFGYTKIVEYQNDQVTVQIDNDKETTIGMLFTFIEAIKADMSIKEYLAQQTTLEQIFNQFAKQDQMEKFNRRLRSSSIRIDK